MLYSESNPLSYQDSPLVKVVFKNSVFAPQNETLTHKLPDSEFNTDSELNIREIDLDGLLMSCMSKMKISADFLSAMGVGSDSSYNLISPRYSNRHGDFVKLAFNRVAQHETIINRGNLLEVLTLPIDSLYQFYQENHAAVEKLFTDLGCRYLIAHRLENAVSSNLADKMREHLAFDSQASILEENKQAIQYGRGLYEKFAHIPLRGDVTDILKRLSIVSYCMESPGLRSLAKDSFRHSVALLKNVFDRDMQLIVPVYESHENFCREVPRSLETVYLLPWKYEEYFRDNENGICVDNRKDRLRFYDSFRSVLEAQIIKSCPDVNPELAIACIQDAARGSLYTWHKKRGGKFLAKTAFFLANAAKTAALLIP